jgi:hypothetical protein
MNAAILPYLSYVDGRLDRIDRGQLPASDEPTVRLAAIKTVAVLTFPDPAEHPAFERKCLATGLLTFDRHNFTAQLYGALLEAINGK